MSFMEERRRLLISLSAKNPTFTIQGQEYEFEKGMKWYDFIASPYNDGRVSRAGPLVLFDNKFHIELGNALEGAANTLVEGNRYTANKYWIFKSYYGLTGTIVYGKEDQFVPSSKEYMSISGIANVIFGTPSGEAFPFGNTASGYNRINLSYSAGGTSYVYAFTYGLSTDKKVYPNVFYEKVQPSVANRLSSSYAYPYKTGNYYFWISKSNNNSRTEYRDIYFT